MLVNLVVVAASSYLQDCCGVLRQAKTRFNGWMILSNRAWARGWRLGGLQEVTVGSPRLALQGLPVDPCLLVCIFNKGPLSGTFRLLSATWEIVCSGLRQTEAVSRCDAAKEQLKMNTPFPWRPHHSLGAYRCNDLRAGVEICNPPYPSLSLRTSRAEGGPKRLRLEYTC